VCRFIATNRPYRVCGSTAGTPPGIRGRIVKSAVRHSKNLRLMVKPHFLQPDEQLGIIAVNIRALTDLSLRFAGELIKNRGGILNVGSVAGFLPGPGMAVYYASKAYVLSFSEALRAELGPRGVRVTLLCPGPVPSEFQHRAGFLPGLDSTVLNISAADVAGYGYRGLIANKRAVLPGLGVKMVPLLLRLFPRAFVLAAVARFQLRKR